MCIRYPCNKPCTVLLHLTGSNLRFRSRHKTSCSYLVLSSRLAVRSASSSGTLSLSCVRKVCFQSSTKILCIRFPTELTLDILLISRKYKSQRKVNQQKRKNISAPHKILLPDNAIFLTDYASEIFISNQNTLILSKKPKIQISLIN